MVSTPNHSTERSCAGRKLASALTGLVMLALALLLGGCFPASAAPPLEGAETGSPMFVVQSAATPTASATSRAGLITVITITPSPTPMATLTAGATPAATATAPIPTPTPAQSSGAPLGAPSAAPAQPSAVSTAASARPQATVQPEATVQPGATVPAVPLAPPPDPQSVAQLRADMQNLYRLMESTLVTMQVLQQGQPTPDEVAAMRAQVNVVAQRLARLMARVQAAQAPGAQALPPTPTATPAPTASVSQEQLHQLLMVMQQTLTVLPTVLDDPNTDAATRAQAVAMLGQLEEMMGQVQALVAQAAGSSAPSGTPSPVPTPTPTAVATQAGLGQGGQGEPSLQQMEQVLLQMQTVLQMMQGQLAPATTPPAGPGQGPAATHTPMPGTPAPASGTTAPATAGAVVPPAPAAGGSGAPVLAPTPAGAHDHGASGAGSTQGGGDMMAMMNSMMSMMQGMMGGGMGASSASPAVGPAAVAGALAKTGQAGDVTLTAAPTNLRLPGLATIDFYVVLDAAATDLGQDLTQLAVLRMPSGQELTPLRWVGPRGGRHVEGTLSFPRSAAGGVPIQVPSYGTLTLQLRHLAGVPERSLAWDLSQVP